MCPETICCLRGSCRHEVQLHLDQRRGGRFNEPLCELQHELGEAESRFDTGDVEPSMDLGQTVAGWSSRQ
jgi:hypothetical protein